MSYRGLGSGEGFVVILADDGAKPVRLEARRMVLFVGTCCMFETYTLMTPPMRTSSFLLLPIVLLGYR